MRLTEQVKQKPRWGQMVKTRRRALKETKAAFGRRFGVTSQAVGYWEAGTYDPPAEVTWYLHKLELAKVRR